MAAARIDYVELPSATAHELTRGFYAKAFGWSFTDYGPDYSSTTTGDVDVGLNGHTDDALSAALPVIPMRWPASTRAACRHRWCRASACSAMAAR